MVEEKITLEAKHDHEAQATSEVPAKEEKILADDSHGQVILYEN